MHNVLVYGTLRPGTTTPVTIPGQMFSLGGFPGVRLTDEPGFTFQAEIVEVDDETLARLDQYEGYYESSPENSLYIRQRFTDPERGIDAWVYEYNHERVGEQVPDGDWLAYVGKPRGGAASFLGAKYDGN
jgi:gamma-glutamylcyclotransferase (GGCT)/AIG2-like uncharacterized protein YtfP